MLGVDGLHCRVLGVKCWVLGDECEVLMACVASIKGCDKSVFLYS